MTSSRYGIGRTAIVSVAVDVLYVIYLLGFTNVSHAYYPLVIIFTATLASILGFALGALAILSNLWLLRRSSSVSRALRLLSALVIACVAAAGWTAFYQLLFEPITPTVTVAFVAAGTLAVFCSVFFWPPGRITEISSTRRKINRAATPVTLVFLVLVVPWLLLFIWPH